MNRPTLSNFRAQWPSEAMGICQADPAVTTYCNEAQQRLMMDPLCPDEGWWGGWVTLNLTATVNNGTAYVVTPREIARLVVLGVCKQPVRIRNGFFEYLQFGAGLKPSTCCGASCGDTFQAYERDTAPTFTDLLSTAQTIRVYPVDPRDAGFRVLIQGKDSNSQVVLTTDPGTGLGAPGEYLPLAFPFVDSVNTFTTISGIQKDETYGPLQFYQVDPDTEVETALVTMEGNEQAANYRRYMINGIPNTNLCCTSAGTVQLTAQGRLDFIPVANETDYLLVQNVPALIEEAMSLRYSRMDSQNAAQQSVLHHVRAISLLNGQLDSYEGKVSTAIAVPIFGSDRMRASFR